MAEGLATQNFQGRLLRSEKFCWFEICETRYSAGARLPNHSHDQSYFCMTVQGIYNEGCDGRIHTCTPLTFAFQPAGSTHFADFGNSEVRNFNVEISSAWLEGHRDCLVGLNYPMYFQGGLPAWLALRLYREYNTMDALSPLVLEGLVLEIVAETSRTARRTPRRVAPPWLKNARDFIHANFSQSLRLTAIAGVVGVHPAHLATSFRQHHGSTVGEYVRKLRVDFACRQMLQSDAPLTEIALAAGFADQSHFSKTFKHVLGIPPSQFRAR